MEKSMPGIFPQMTNTMLCKQKIREHHEWVNRLKSRQREIYEIYRAYIKHPCEATKPPLITWVNGNAGTGKSEVIRRILVYTELKHQIAVRTAFNSINAIQIGGCTSASLLHFRGQDVEKLCGLQPTEFLEFKELIEKAILIVIDEFSNQAPWHLAKFSNECQRATGNYHLPFGGIPVIMGGDLGQMGPVKAGKSIPDAILDICLHSSMFI
jgi:tRNA A37 threonylcarbamoyladenosine biosynthesis protein TsaE